MLSLLSLTGLLLSYTAVQVSAFDNSRSDNVAVYWGQNSYGATHSDTANFQKSLAFYCQDNSIDAFPIAFLNVFFGAGGLPSIDLANICNVNDDAVFPGTQLPNCQFLASDIQTCQAKGKIVTLSLGGATGAAGFTSDSQAQAFADTIWNTFLGGSSSTRPFGNAVLDGIDLDIEGGSNAHFVAFLNQLRSHMNSASKKYFITAAPQCPFPDAILGSVINSVAFDAVYVQFYNNFCGLQNFNNPNAWNFATWDNWAKTTSPNRNVKVYIGVPASSTAAGSGFVPIGTLTSIIQQTRSQFSSFGGVMMWDASQAFANGRFDAAVKAALGGGSAPPPAPPPSSTKPPTTPPPTSAPPTSTSAPPPPTSGSCAGVNAWVGNVAYNGGDRVVFNAHLWTAKWWSFGDTPGGAAGDWQDDGACSSFSAANVRPHYESKSVPLDSPVKTPAAALAMKENAKHIGSRFFRF
ncbi:glycoside hydrolase [Cristinia sonorae]|uniref:chitinase n=1 Tax=Cristinia sonorae TaxID=1940300 RepID=A0A8K0XPV9_9AGAR|nr:glycoside hydrolase [Cristinia sonorae]